MSDLSELARRLRPAAYVTANGPRPLPPRGKGLAYVMAGNGVFKVARSERLAAWAPLAKCYIPGLAEVAPGIALRQKVPGGILAHILEDAKRAMSMADGASIARPIEAMYFVHQDEGGQVRVAKPRQVGSAGRVRCKACNEASVVMEIHSHHQMAAHFSGVDDRDETGFRLYGVIGRIFTRPEIALRVGVYGTFLPLRLDEVFSGDGWPVIEANYKGGK